MDRANYGTRSYTAKLSSGGIYALVLNPKVSGRATGHRGLRRR